MATPGSIISHVSLGTNDFARAKAFYDQLLPTLQIKFVMSHGDVAAAYGRAFPEFWIVKPLNGQPANAGNGTHISFLANSIDEVKSFHAKALQLGAKDEGAPRYRPEYTATYYGAFVRDLDDHKIEAMLMVAQEAGAPGSQPHHH